MGRAVVLFQERELFAGLEIGTLPAARESFLSATISYFAVGRPAIASAGLLAAHFHHCAQQVIALVVVLEFLEERHLCQHVSHLAEPVAPQFLSQVSRYICYCLRIADMWLIKIWLIFVGWGGNFEFLRGVRLRDGRRTRDEGE